MSSRARLGSAVTARTLRPFSQVAPQGRLGVAITRAIIASSMHSLGQGAPDTDITRIRHRSPDGQVIGEWVRPAAARRTDAVILYLHGSAFVACSPRTHRKLVSRIAAASGTPAFTVQYRRAPRHRFPAASDDALRAYRWLVHQGHQRIVVAGDSAGGHLAVDLALELARTGEQQPEALVLLSPLYDTSFSLAAARELVQRDPMISAARARTLVDHYTVGVDPDHHRLRLAVREAPALPPTLIQAGGAEMLAADAEQLAADITAAGGTCELQVWPGQMHVFQAMPRMAPEAGRAVGVVGRFVRRQLATPAAATRKPKPPRVTRAAAARRRAS
ncbi:alpha/beta hydrolase [Aeromicrobium marinum]|uniref:alpha/beta hydrolase n=1 Tax=Aeromicrobium marinum TaxID=219314 RepID=UPI001FDEB15F|nr:alpha/beta hydrolase [Aeromicrobium marinum]